MNKQFSVDANNIEQCFDAHIVFVVLSAMLFSIPADLTVSKRPGTSYRIVQYC